MADPVADPGCFLCVDEMCVYIATDAEFTEGVFKLPRIQSVQPRTTENRPDKRADSDTQGLRVAPCPGTVDIEVEVAGNYCLTNWIEEYILHGDEVYLRMYPDCNDGGTYHDWQVRVGVFDGDPFDNNSAEPVGWRNIMEVLQDFGWTGIADPTNEVTTLPVDVS